MHFKHVQKLRIAGISLFLIIVGTVAVLLVEHVLLDRRSFSDTQSWDALVYEQKNLFMPLVGSDAFSITLPPPPKNSSRETKQELAYLHELADKRTPEQLAEIEAEINLDSTRFGPWLYEELRNEKPKTEALISRALSEFSAVVIAQKEIFDRIRPNILDETLTIAIDLPAHPAYPSGHASQSKLIALLLSELDPIHADEYHESAARIAENRVIAGVHYPSDSIGGQLLAERYFALLEDNEEFQSLFEEAKAEW